MKISIRNELQFPGLLAKRLLIILLLYEIARIYFYFINKDLFPDIGIGGLVRCLIFGIRFDLSAIVYTNMIFILLHIIPFDFRSNRYYQIICKVLFYLVNLSIFFIMLGDAEYYAYSLRHGTIELLYFMRDFIALLPAYLIDLWYLFPATFIIIALVEFLYRKTMASHPGNVSSRKNFLIQLLLFPIVLGLVFLMARGGLQKYPLAPIHAAKYVPPSWTPMLTNTPFYILYSIFQPNLKPVNYLTQKEVSENFYFIKQPRKGDSIMPSSSGAPDNILIIIMESFSAEYTGQYLGEKSATPFLDS